MNCHILRFLHVDFNPFRLRAWYRKSKRERRWVEMKGEMIQIKISRCKRKVQASHEPSGPYNLPLRFEHLREQMVRYKSTREKVYRLTDPRAVGRAINKKRKLTCFVNTAFSIAFISLPPYPHRFLIAFEMHPGAPKADPHNQRSWPTPPLEPTKPFPRPGPQTPSDPRGIP